MDQAEALPTLAIRGKGVELIPTTAKETWASLFFPCVRLWPGKLENKWLKLQYCKSQQPAAVVLWAHLLYVAKMVGWMGGGM